MRRRSASTSIVWRTTRSPSAKAKSPTSPRRKSSIRYRPIPDDTVKLQSLQGTEVDALDYLAPRTVSIAKSDNNLVVIDVPSLAAFWLMLNTTKPPFDNKSLRQALMYALDIEAIVKGVYLGVGVPANGPISPSSWAYDDTIKPIKRDLQKPGRCSRRGTNRTGLRSTTRLSTYRSTCSRVKS